MTFAELIAPLQATERYGSPNVEVTDLTDDSRGVKPGSVFVAVKGGRVDGHAFVRDAVAAGATPLVLQDRLPTGLPIPMIRGPHSRRALGLLARRLRPDPPSPPRLVGATRANGKTTRAP